MDITYLARSLLRHLCARAAVCLAAASPCHARSEAHATDTAAQGAGRRGKRSGGYIGERHGLRELDRVQQLHDHIGDVPERELPPTADGRSNAQSVEHQGLKGRG